MDHSLPLNAFQSVRPRGPDLDIPAGPTKSKASQSRETSSFGTVKVLDRRGNATVTLAPRVMGSISIENREQAQASVDKRKRISKAGTK